MDRALTQLRAAAEPTRLRLLALCARGAFCVSDLCEVLGQSQPRLSRHLRLLVEAGLLERVPEGANAYFGLPPDADLARLILARLPEDDPLLAAAASPEIASLLQPLPLEVLYEIGLAPAVRLAARETPLSGAELDRVAGACWRAVTRPG